MTDSEDRPKKREPDLTDGKESDDLELVGDDDIVATNDGDEDLVADISGDKDLEEDISTSELDVPDYIRSKLEQSLPENEDLVGEDPFEGDAETLGEDEDDVVFEDEELVEEQTNDIRLSSKEAGESVGDTMEEPVAPRRRSRRRRRSADGEAADLISQGVPSPAKPTDGMPWSQDEEAPSNGEDGREAPDAGEPMYPEDTESWTPEALRDASQSTGSAAEPSAAEPIGDDPAREKTLILGDEPELGPPEYPFLVVVRGEEEGREIELTRAQVTMGRGVDNDLVFPDIACSRRHCILEELGGDFVIADLGSGNGTLVNGIRIQRAVLGDGDEIEIGSTILQFNMPFAVSGHRGAQIQAVTSTHPMPPEGRGGFLADLLADLLKKKLVLYGGGGVLGLLFILLLIKAVSGPAEPPGRSPAEFQRQDRLRIQQELDKHMQESRSLVKEKKWMQAQLSIQLALKLDPQNRLALDYRDFIVREVSAQTALQTARNFIEQKAWDEAISVINQVSGESECYAEVAGLKRNIELGVKADLVGQGKALMKEKSYKQALVRFDEVLRRDPGHKKAMALRRAVVKEIGKEESRVAKLEKMNKRKTGTLKKKKKKESKKKGSLRGRLLALYKNGEIDKVIEKAKAFGATEQLVKLKKFKSVYSRGMELSRNKGQVKQAIGFLKQAIALDKKIAGGAGKYRQQIKEKLGQNYFVKGVDAHMNKRYPEAYKSYKASLKYYPGYKLSGKRLQGLEKIAKKFYEEAYIIKSTNADEAVLKLNTVMQIVPPHHVYYGKAKHLKRSIQGPLSREPTGNSGF
jgi:pSer/pThr/pTyr-binding forkhead associated (FHA) protein